MKLFRSKQGTASDTPKPDRTGDIIVALVGTALSALVIFYGTVEVGRSLEESRIEKTYGVTIKDGVRDGRFTVDSWGPERDCQAPVTDSDFEKPLQCRVAVHETVTIEPSRGS